MLYFSVLWMLIYISDNLVGQLTSHKGVKEEVLGVPGSTVTFDGPSNDF